MKQMLSAGLSAVLAVSMLAGCGSKTETPATTAAAGEVKTTAAEAGDGENQEPVTITFWDGNWNEDAFGPVKQAFEEKYPWITVEGEFQVDNGMSDKYTLALKNGTAPDVVACALDWITTFGNAGLLEPLDEYLAKDNIDTGNYVQGAIDASTIDGSLYGIPFRSETYVLFYNVDMLKEAGFTEPPKTWDDVLEIAAACTKDDKAGYGICGANYGNVSFQYITMLRCLGGDILTDDNKASALDTEAAIQAAELYDQLKQYAPASYLENSNVENRTLFASGKVAMYLTGIYDAETIAEANPDLNFACAMVPTGNDSERKTILGGWSVGISECSKNKEAAAKFVEFLTSTEIASMYTNTFTGTGEPAARFADYDASIMDANKEALQYAKALPAVGAIVPIRQTIFDNIQLALAGSEDAKTAILDASDKVNELLAQ